MMKPDGLSERTNLKLICASLAALVFIAAVPAAGSSDEEVGTEIAKQV